MNRSRAFGLFGPSASSSVGVVLASALAVGALYACSSSSDGGGTKVNRADGTGAVSNDGSAGSQSSAGGSMSVFTIDGGLIADAQPGIIKPDAACGESTIVATPREVNILLVIDESGSMTGTPTGFSSDKWTAMKDALGKTLTAVQNDIAFGLELFPYPLDPKKPLSGCTDNCCEMPAVPGINIPVGAGATTVPKIVAALEATKPGGGTPTAIALARANDYFATGEGKALTGDRYVLLATDGGPDCNSKLTCATAAEASRCTTNIDGLCPATVTNCCDPQFSDATANTRCLDDVQTQKEIASLASAGVKTFVVGIPGTEAYRTSLDGFASAGGEENKSGATKYFEVSASGGTAALKDVLGSITTSLVTTCRLQLTSKPEDADKLNVLVDGVRIPKNAGGWRLDDTTSPATVELLGDTCTKVKSEGAQRVQVLFGCKTVIR
jgi:hypothetical protein